MNLVLDIYCASYRYIRFLASIYDLTMLFEATLSMPESLTKACVKSKSTLVWSHSPHDIYMKDCMGKEAVKPTWSETGSI